MKTKQMLVLAAAAVCLGLFFAFDLRQYLSLDALRQSQAQLSTLYDQSPWTVALVFFVAYVAATAASIPGATILTLAGGAIFGLGWGLLLVSFASTIGATLAFLAARFLLRDWVQARFAARLADVDKGVQRDGAFYLFGLRLIPVVPFFVINLAMGLTAMRAWTFY